MWLAFESRFAVSSRMKKRGAAIRKRSERVPTSANDPASAQTARASDSETLAGQLDISAMAVRQHLYALRTANAGEPTEEPRPSAAQSKCGVPTPAAESAFPDAHAGLTVNLLNAARTDLRRRRRPAPSHPMRQTADCGLPLTHPRRAPLQARLEALISIRNEEGFMAEAQRQRDGSFLLIENHCPISAAANVCPKLCEAEMESSSPFLARASPSREPSTFWPAPVAAFTAFGQARVEGQIAPLGAKSN